MPNSRRSRVHHLNPTFFVLVLPQSIYSNFAENAELLIARLICPISKLSFLSHKGQNTRPRDYLRETRKTDKLSDMKTVSSKNNIIAVLVLSNVILVCALMAMGAGHFRWPGFKSASPQIQKARNDPSTATLESATFKPDTAVQACYNTFLARTPSLSEGVVVMQWMFNREGRIDALDLVRTDLPDQTFMTCLMDTIREARIPASDSRVGKLISHKFNFRNRTPAAMEFQ